ncbi:MAG: hypothetical protein DUD35_14195 [Lactobacillus sp.]|nr:MAG: hypothetical protein DUD35_14195 [Lactobacillus sp.]
MWRGMKLVCGRVWEDIPQAVAKIFEIIHICGISKMSVSFEMPCPEDLKFLDGAVLAGFDVKGMIFSALFNVLCFRLFEIF